MQETSEGVGWGIRVDRYEIELNSSPAAQGLAAILILMGTPMEGYAGTPKDVQFRLYFYHDSTRFGPVTVQQDPNIVWADMYDTELGPIAAGLASNVPCVVGYAGTEPDHYVRVFFDFTSPENYSPKRIKIDPSLDQAPAKPAHPQLSTHQ